MKTYRCKDSHPTLLKIQKIFELMEDLGITMDPHQVGGETVVYDRDIPGQRFHLLDLEDSEYENTYSPVDFPPALEWKLTFKKEV